MNVCSRKLLAMAWPANGMRSMRLCTGIFDLLHRGHVEFLQSASAIAHENATHLVVGINSDASTRRLKGAGRPVINEEDRAYMLLSLACVYRVFLFDEDTVAETLKELRPELWIKGGDRTLETLDQNERRTAEEIGTKIVFIPRIGEYSTTGILERMKV